MQKKFLLNQENFSEVTKQVHDELLTTKATKKEVLRTDLLIEETFLRMTELEDVAEVEIKIRQRLGDVSLQMSASGEEFNQLIEVTEFDEEDENYFRRCIHKKNMV